MSIRGMAIIGTIKLRMYGSIQVLFKLMTRRLYLYVAES